MNSIAICSALNNSYLAFKFNDKIVSKIIKSDEKNYHSLYLLPEIKEILNKNNWDLKDFDFITVNCGPGSFTGIRVALSIAKTIASELDKPLVPLNTAEILLNAFNKDILLMDARRDMFFVGNKEKIELIYKDKINEILTIANKEILCDKRCFEMLEKSDLKLNTVCFEDVEIDLGQTMLKLAEEKFKSSKDKEEFNFLKVSANYIQTPPVF